MAMHLQLAQVPLIVWFALAVCNISAAATVPEGTHVFPRNADVELHEDGKAIEKAQSGMMLEVIKVEGPWIWVGRGWVADHDVVPMKDALAFYDQLISKGQNYFALVTRARVRYERREYDSAVNDCSEALRIVPEGTAAFCMRARALARLSRHKEAFADVDAAIRIDPKFGPAYAVRGHLWLEISEAAKAVEDFNRGIELDPKSAWAYGGRGRAHSTLGDQEHAIADFSAALKINPHLRAVWNNRGNAWYKKGDYSHAVGDYSVALNLAPSADVYYHRALAWAKLGATAKADSDRAKALELDPGFGPAKRNDPKGKTDDQAASRARDL
jgi:tetratricopeptide (TPR) repeat protein